MIARPAVAEVAERIVGIVGEQVILQSELEHRARPFKLQIRTTIPPERQNEALKNMHVDLLGTMIDELIVSNAADKLNVTVSTKEIEDELKVKAAEAKSSIADLVADAEKQGLSELDLRQEMRRQILFGKMLETRVRNRVRATEDDAKDYYRTVLVSERRSQSFSASLVALDVDAGEEGSRQRQLADDIVRRARNGEDFAALAKRYSIDATRERGGDLGTLKPGTFGKGIDEAVLRLGVGDVSEPLVSGARILILKVTRRERSQVPRFEEVKDQLMTHVKNQMLQKQIKIWLSDLKAGVFIARRL
ncbi:MAG: peptidylprolyl isomerase [Polyangiales bacterium]